MSKEGTIYSLEIEFDTEEIWTALDNTEIPSFVGRDGCGVENISNWESHEREMKNFSGRFPYAVFKLSIRPAGRSWPILKFYQAGNRIPNPIHRKEVL